MLNARCVLSMHDTDQEVEGIQYRGAPGLMVHRHEEYWRVTHMSSGLALVTVKQWQGARDLAEAIAELGDFTQSSERLQADEDLMEKIRDLRSALPADLRVY